MNHLPLICWVKQALSLPPCSLSPRALRLGKQLTLRVNRRAIHSPIRSVPAAPLAIQISGTSELMIHGPEIGFGPTFTFDFRDICIFLHLPSQCLHLLLSYSQKAGAPERMFFLVSGLLCGSFQEQGESWFSSLRSCPHLTSFGSQGTILAPEVLCVWEKNVEFSPVVRGREIAKARG